MRARLVVWASAATATLVLISTWWLSAPEAIQVRAIEDVPLFDPATLAGAIGGTPKVVGYLKSDENLEVLACVDRKSDINLHASYQGKVVAVGEWKAKVQLLRRHAYPWEHGAITSCRGYFESVSKQA